MLCDDFHFQCHSGSMRLANPSVLNNYLALDQELSRMPKFSLDEKIIDLVAHCLSDFDADTMLRALPLCKLPHNPMWIEYPFSIKDAAIDRHFGIRFDESKDRNTAKPVRVGLILSEKDGVISARLVNKFDLNGAVSRSEVFGNFLWPITYMPWEIRIATGPNIPFLLETEYVEHQRFLRERMSYFRSLAVINRNPGSEQGLNQLESRMMQTWAAPEQHLGQRFIQLFESQMLRGKDDPTCLAMRAMLGSWMLSLSGDFALALVLLMLMNTREMIQVGEAPDLTKINRIRAKTKVPPMQPVRPIQIHLSARNVKRFSRLGYTRREDMEEQKVRGHFKVRKTGVFWWMPHKRYEKASTEPGKVPIYEVKP